MEGLAKIERKVCEGGPTIDGARVTFHDRLDPVVIVILKAQDTDGSDMSVSLMVKKSNLYLIGYLLGDDYTQAIWRVLDKQVIEMKGNWKPAGFNGSYFNKDSNKKIKGDRLGGRVVLGAMKTLHDADASAEQKKEAFLCLVYHISEAIRFNFVWDIVCPTMDDEAEEANVTDYFKDLVRDWKILSSDLHNEGENKVANLRVALREHALVKMGRAEKAKIDHNIGKTCSAFLFDRVWFLRGLGWDDKSRMWFANGWARHYNLRRDVCIDIVRALGHEDITMARLIVQNSYILLKTSSLSLAYDFYGIEYRIQLAQVSRENAEGEFMIPH